MPDHPDAAASAIAATAAATATATELDGVTALLGLTATASDRLISRAQGLEATAAALSGVMRVDEVAEVAVREGLTRLGAGRGIVGLLDADGHTVRPASPVGFRTHVLDDWPAFDIGDDVPMAEAMRLRQPLIIETSAELSARYPSIGVLPNEGGPAVVIPLMHDQAAIGALYFRYEGSTAITHDDLPYLEALARTCALAVERARLYEAQAAAWEEARQAQERVAFLSQVGEALAGEPDIRAAMARITAFAVPRIADWAAVFLRDGDRLDPVAIDHAGGTELEAVRAFLLTRPPTMRDNEGVGAAVATGRVNLIPDYRPVLGRVDPASEIRQLFDKLDLRSVMHCPVLGDETVFGSVTLATVGDRVFTEEEARFGEELGRRVGTALEKVRLNAQIRARLRREEAIARIGQQALERPELEPLFDTVSRELADVLGADVVSIHELVDDRSVLRIVGGIGWRPGIVGHSEIPANARSQAGYAIATNAPVVSADYERERRFRPSPLILDHAARSGVTTTIRSNHGPWGALGVYSQAPNRFDSDEVAFLEAVANVLGSAIGRRQVETRLEELVEAERRASELGQAFIGVVSHELRTPITSIYAGAKLLHRLVSKNPDRRLEDLTTDIEAEADRLYRLTEDLLVLTRVERGGLEVGTEPLLLPILVERVVANERTRWPSHVIEVEASPNDPIVLGDPTYVEQLVRNLVGNAAKYSPPGSTILVVVSPESPTEMAVRVLDEGAGLADEDIDHLFQLFYRSARTARKAPGAGIGLFVCAQLAQAMGGRTWAGNRPGGGSEFGFALTVHAAGAHEVTEEPDHLAAHDQLIPDLEPPIPAPAG
jgi:signal transduction histidine kinase